MLSSRTVKRNIAKAEDLNIIKDHESITLFLSPFSQTPIDDADTVSILNGTGPGSTSQEPLALVSKMSNSQRSILLESKRRGGRASAAEPDTTIQYCTSIQHSRSFLFVVTSRLLGEVYYQLYADDYEMPSKVSFDPERSSLGRIRADSVAPPHSPTSIKRCILRVEGNPLAALACHADLFADASCDTPLKETYISIRRSPGLSPNEPMAVVIIPPIPDGRYLIKNRARNIKFNNVYWWRNVYKGHFNTVYFYPSRRNLEDDMMSVNMNMEVSNQSPIIEVFKE